MESKTLFRSGKHTIALVGNYLPRRCGIATFSTDLLTAIATESPASSCFAVAMNDIPQGYDYPQRVRFEVDTGRLEGYQLAAEFLNVNQVDVVSLQHEYGIFGGKYGSHIRSLLRNLRVPLVTTLHTVLESPKDEQKILLREICDVSARVVVMSKKAVGFLKSVYGVSGEQVKLIPHGIHDVPFVDPSYFKDQFGVEGRKVMLAFGLLSPRKGLEYLVEALPKIVKKHPEVVCIILGATHPNVIKKQGESYRISLQMLARKLGVEKHLIFHNRFVELKELIEFISAADLYVTPYLIKDQITSGALAYALGAGKATISTPYWHAEELLAKGRGRLVPFRDAKALAKQVLDLLDNETERHAMRKRAYSYCRGMIWKEVSRSYLQVFAEVEKEWQRNPRVLVHPRLSGEKRLTLPRIKLDHLSRLTDDLGILQYARFIVPDREHGYALDDNARALIATLLAQQQMPEEMSLADLGYRYLGFLLHAYDEQANSFRSVMDYDRRWRPGTVSQDGHGRVLWALGKVAGAEAQPRLSDLVLGVFKRGVLALPGFDSPRAWAYSLVGINSYLQRFSGDREIRRVQKQVAELLLERYRANAKGKWRWFEDTVTYDNGKMPQALIVSGYALKNDTMLKAGLRCLEWLVEIQTSADGSFEAVGNRGWYTKGGNRARFDQQPIEAQSVLEACLRAYRVTGKKKWEESAWRCLEWFLGQNRMNIALYDYDTGGCCDGLTADGANRNQGAESTLAWLLALLQMYNHQHYKAGLKGRERVVRSAAARSRKKVKEENDAKNDNVG